MDPVNILALVLTLTALFSFLNYRYVGLPTTIGVMAIALLLSLLLGIIGMFAPEAREVALELVKGLNFDRTLLQGMLSYLLFAGALHVNINDLTANWRIIAALAIFGTILSVASVGLMAWGLLGFLGITLSVPYCLLFGALISPTDPIAVIGILKSAGTPRSLEAKITGESLFNDGVGVVLFLLLLEVVSGNPEENPANLALVVRFFLREAVGGVLFGFISGYLTFLMLKRVDNHQVEMLLTLALVSGGYALASLLHLSGPLAVVVAGLLIGNKGRLLAMSENSRDRIDTFWELIDEILNAVLFLLIGLETLLLTYQKEWLAAGILIIPIVLFSRFLAVATPVTLLRKFRSFSPGAVRIMTWGGLRGGISVALALSLPHGEERDMILSMTYAVVLFSILVQGLTIGPLVRKLCGK